MSEDTHETFTLPGDVDLEMAWVEPGTFLLGSVESEPGRWDDEGPQHEVTLTRGFFLGKYAVTQEVWANVMGARPWARQDYVLENPVHPAVYVSWEDAQAFVKRLNVDEASSSYRLPTESEWEYACRAGTTTPWSFGEDEAEIGDYAWYRGNAWDAGEPYAHPVGAKLSNPLGIHDMHGNVWEWVSDWHGDYSAEPKTDPQGPEKGTIRVLKGSGFSSLARAVRSAFRYGYTPKRRFHCIGFRLLREAI